MPSPTSYPNAPSDPALALAQSPLVDHSFHPTLGLKAGGWFVVVVLLVCAKKWATGLLAKLFEHMSIPFLTIFSVMLAVELFELPFQYERVLNRILFVAVAYLATSRFAAQTLK